MATENRHSKKSAPKKKRVEVDALEKEEIIRLLALTDCTRATAHRVGRDPMIVHRIKQANRDQILTVRAELVRDQHYEFVSVIKVTQSRIRDMIDQMELPEDPAEYPAFLGSLENSWRPRSTSSPSCWTDRPRSGAQRELSHWHRLTKRLRRRWTRTI